MAYAMVEGSAWSRLNNGGASVYPDFGENEGENQATISKTLTWVMFGYLTLDSIRGHYEYQVTGNQTCSGCLDPCVQVYDRFWK
jgi:VCBS repeat-containing protein